MELSVDLAVRAMRAGAPDRMIFIGVDLGKLEDYSAIVVWSGLRRCRWILRMCCGEWARGSGMW